MGEAYPELREHRGQCRSLIKSEEEGFAGVYRAGMTRLADFVAAAPPASRGGQRMLEGSGEFAFQLHDTYGFPVDLTRQVMAEHGLLLDDAGFEAAMAAQRDRARAASATSDAVFATNVAMVLRDRKLPVTQFVGYERLQAASRILALSAGGDRLVERARAGDSVQVVVAATPFYAQGGGQVGDRGRLRTAGGEADVRNVTQLDGYFLHEAAVRSGELAAGQEVELQVDEAARRATERNHTATHLLHAALKNVLGRHVGQAGSEVAPERLRFDYTHGERPTEAQLEAIEDEVNRVIAAAIPVAPVVKPIAVARNEGFLAMFGEKYGEQVRTLSVGDYSRELCGGTHVANSGNIGAFRIVSEGAISAGTRRIEAVTGPVALRLWRQDQRTVGELARALKVGPSDLVPRVQALGDELRRVRKELERATAADLGQYFRELAGGARQAGGARTVVFRCRGLGSKEVQELLQQASRDLAPFAGAVLSVGDDEVTIGAAVSDGLTAKVKAGDLVRDASKLLGGGGGGRPHLAQGKGKDVARVDEAVALLERALAAALGG
jgi:alanyl-tRNA synthetase